MEPKFKVGEIVRVRDLAEIRKDGRNIPFPIADGMLSCSFCYYRIDSASMAYDAADYPNLDCDGYLYMLDGDDERWSWSSPMLEKVCCDAQDTRTKDETSFIDEVQKSLERIASACGVPKSILSKEDVEPLKLAIKKHSVKLNFKN